VERSRIWNELILPTVKHAVLIQIPLTPQHNFTTGLHADGAAADGIADRLNGRNAWPFIGLEPKATIAGGESQEEQRTLKVATSEGISHGHQVTIWPYLLINLARGKTAIFGHDHGTVPTDCVV